MFSPGSQNRADVVASAGAMLRPVLRTGAKRYNDPMANSADVVILGGGVIGLTAAHYLAAAGARVTLVDKADFGQ